MRYKNHTQGWRRFSQPYAHALFFAPAQLLFDSLNGHRRRSFRGSKRGVIEE